MAVVALPFIYFSKEYIIATYSDTLPIIYNVHCAAMRVRTYVRSCMFTLITDDN